MQIKRLRYQFLVVFGILSILGCKKRTTKDVVSYSPPTLKDADGSKDTCAVDGNALQLSSQALPAIDAAKLQVADLNVIEVGYADRVVSSIAVAFEGLNSSSSPEYIPDYGLIEILTDDAQPKVVYSKQTVSYSETIPLPPKYLGAKLFVQVSACVIPSRRATNAACGAEKIKVPIVQDSIAGASLRLTADSGLAGQINQHNLLIRVNEDRRAEMCKSLGGKARQFLASLSAETKTTLTSDQKILVSVAQFAANDPVSFGTLCTSAILDDLHEMKGSYDQYVKENPEEQAASFYLADNCVSSPATADSVAPQVDPLRAEKDACLVKSGFVWDAVALSCVADPKIAELNLKGKAECEAKAAEGFEWQDVGQFCLKTVAEVKEASTEEACDKLQGIWDVDRMACSLKAADAVDLGFEFSLNPEAIYGRCLSVGLLNSKVEHGECKADESSQLFQFRAGAKNGGMLIENKEGKACLELAAKEQEAYLVNSVSCDRDSLAQSFKMIKKTLDDLSSYMTFVSEKKAEDGSSLCLTQEAEGDLKVSQCSSKTEYALAKNQSFLLKPFGGKAARVQKSAGFSVSSIISEVDGQGNKCLAAGDLGKLSVSDCKAGDPNQIFSASTNGSIAVKVNEEGKETTKCVDYSLGTDELSSLSLNDCQDDLSNQRFVVKKVKVNVSGTEREFTRIGLFELQKTSTKCLLTKNTQVFFGDCIESTDFTKLQTQLFTVKAGGGAREAFPDKEEVQKSKNWYDNLAGSAKKDAWKKSGISMLVIGSVFCSSCCCSYCS